MDRYDFFGPRIYVDYKLLRLKKFPQFSSWSVEKLAHFCHFLF
jgi:hypothetical protein